MKTMFRYLGCFLFALSVQSITAAHHERGEALGSYQLQHVTNVYSKDANGDIILQTNWKGTADNFGQVFGTLTLGPNTMDTLASDLPSRAQWIGQAFLPDGTMVVGDGYGVLSTSPEQHKWEVEIIMDLSGGDKILSVGVIDLETLTWSGKNYPAK